MNTVETQTIQNIVETTLRSRTFPFTWPVIALWVVLGGAVAIYSLVILVGIFGEPLYKLYLIANKKFGPFKFSCPAWLRKLWTTKIKNGRVFSSIFTLFASIFTLFDSLFTIGKKNKSQNAEEAT
ncbi:hypothetical protein ENBRE01_2412 [Enteropsectra breve]|nr:hypothetical protein ENBRE01_2412 [Enteropsectra breve]